MKSEIIGRQSTDEGKLKCKNCGSLSILRECTTGDFRCQECLTIVATPCIECFCWIEPEPGQYPERCHYCQIHFELLEALP